MNDDALERCYQEGLEERLIAYPAKERHVSLEQAMDIYYRSNLADAIHEGRYGGAVSRLQGARQNTEGLRTGTFRPAWFGEVLTSLAVAKVN